jgi:CheY-like chemotaxis protein/HPt (histidine-containing phosphotransfer) domain-containing protein
MPTVLLIDDDAISREVIAMILELSDFKVLTAEDGASALALFEDGSVPDPQAILMDSQMPGLSGLRLVKALRVRTAARIIAISGSPVTDSLLKATDGFLLKPVEAEALLAMLNSESPLDVQVRSLDAGVGDTGDIGGFIDGTVLGKLKAMMPASAVREIYTAVAVDLDSRLVSLETAMVAGDSIEVQRSAHAIKGGCAMVGLTIAQEAAARLEISNAPVTYPTELAHLHAALIGLKGILENDFPL